MSAISLPVLDLMGIEMAAVPIDTTAAAVVGDYVSLKNYSAVTWVISQGAWAAGTPAVTVDQAKTVSGGSVKDYENLDFYWSMTALTGTTWAKTAVTSDTFNLTAVANIMTLVTVTADSLDQANGFDCVQLDIESPGANADLIAVFAILHGNRYPQGLGLPNAKVD